MEENAKVIPIVGADVREAHLYQQLHALRELHAGNRRFWRYRRL